MPVIVVGADTPIGSEIIAELAGGGELRVFATDPEQGETFRQEGCKVALGDVSDGSHVEVAALECFTAVLIAQAAVDGRERSFADSPSAVGQAWIEAVRGAGVQRMIWVGSHDFPYPPSPDSAPEVAVVSNSADGVAREVARLNELNQLN